MQPYFLPDNMFIGAKGLVIIGTQVLVYKRSADAPTHPLQIDVPGGGREAKETPFQTFQREVQEEFGLQIDRSDVVYARRYPSLEQPEFFSWFCVAKLPAAAKQDIRFGDEGIAYYLMPVREYLARKDAWRVFQDHARDFLTAT
jgi:8-oxo-dGTP diphosphatase